MRPSSAPPPLSGVCGDALRDALDPKLRGTLGSGKKTKRAKRTKNVKEVA